MEKIIEKAKAIILQGADYISAGINWFSEVLQANPVITTIVIGIAGLIAVYLILKELWDIATCSNKSALQEEVKLLNEHADNLENEYKILKGDYDELKFHADALERENKDLKTTAFDELFPPDLLASVCQTKFFDAVDVDDIAKEEVSEIKRPIIDTINLDGAYD